MLGTEIRLAFLNLVRERKRALIALAAIVVGVAGYVLAGGFIDWIFWAIRESTIDNGLGHIQVSARGFRAAGRADLGRFTIPVDSPLRNAIAGLDGVRVVGARLTVSGLASHGDVTVPFAAEGVEPGIDRRIATDLVVDGEPLDPVAPTGVVLGKGLARALGVRRGDKIAFITATESGGMSGAEGLVRGVFSTGVKAYDDLAVRMPLRMAQQLARVKGAQLWVVRLDDTSRTDAVAREMRGIVAGSGMEVRTWHELSDFYRKTVTLMSRQMTVVAALIAVILVLGIANVLMMSTLERTREIGTMLAMGTPRRSVLRMHIAEGVLLGCAGAVLGVTAGALLAVAISWFGIPMPPPPGRDTGYDARILLEFPVIVNAIVLAFASAALAGIYPAWKASRMPIVDALRTSA
jgi:putative ABC transport system permease protein